jgi:hypothetical protein
LVTSREGEGADATTADDDNNVLVATDDEVAKKRRRQERWDRIVKTGQERAIANKKKREPATDRKRRTF